MSVDGNWNLTMSTPMGERNATLTLTSAGGTLTGTQAADGNSARSSTHRHGTTWMEDRITNPMR